MEADRQQMRGQLKRWRSEIDDLTATIQTSGGPVGFETLAHIDELKALHALAHTKFVAFEVMEDTKRARLEAELENIWSELDAALKSPILERWR